MIMTLYKINFPNQKSYVGVTSSLKNRHKQHKDAALGRSNLLVHKAIRKYCFDDFGGVNFKLEPLVVGPRDYILDLESKVIEAFGLRDIKRGYNVCSGGLASPMNDPEIAAKVSAKLKGRKLSEETRAKISAAGLGRKSSPEAIANMCTAQKGRIITQAAREKISAARTGTKASEETRAKMTSAHTGNTRAQGYKHSAETRAKVRVAQIARREREKASDIDVYAAQREKIRATLKGRTISEAALVNMRIAQTARWARVRAQRQILEDEHP